jgi:ABC-type Fe3+-hydroxamate transport system substrate-binding protein
LIDQLKPDLIIGNKEENEYSAITRLAEKYPVWMSDVSSFEDSLRMIEDVGQITDRVSEAAALITQIETAFSAIKQRASKRVLYLIWKSPWMAAGKSTFIDSMLVKGGWQNALEVSRYPSLPEHQLTELNPDLIFLSSEPFPFAEKHVEEVQSIWPDATVLLVDGELFSWYGSRMLLVPDYFNSLSV